MSSTDFGRRAEVFRPTTIVASHIAASRLSKDSTATVATSATLAVMMLAEADSNLAVPTARNLISVSGAAWPRVTSFGHLVRTRGFVRRKTLLLQRTLFACIRKSSTWPTPSATPAHDDFNESFASINTLQQQQQQQQQCNG